MNTVAQPDDITLGGHWMLTLIMIVIGLRIVFKYLSPNSWKEWRNTGVLQEMSFHEHFQAHSSQFK